MDRRAENREKALKDLQQSKVLMIDGHFDYGNGYHGRVYLNPHQLFRHPSTIWRFAQDLLDVLPGEVVQRTEVVAGPVTGGALLAHTIAGLLDSRRSLTHPPCSFAVQQRPGGRLHAARLLRARTGRQTRPPRRRCAEYGRNVCAMRGAREGSQRYGAGDGRDLRSPRGGRRNRCAEFPAGGIQGPRELHSRGVPALRCTSADHKILKRNNWRPIGCTCGASSFGRCRVPSATPANSCEMYFRRT